MFEKMLNNNGATRTSSIGLARTGGFGGSARIDGNAAWVR